jgi:hypothetical protein
MRFTRRTNIALIIAGVVFLPVFLISALLVVDSLIPSPARQALPSSATDVQEYCDNSLNGDYERRIRAQMPEKDVAPFAAKMGLVERYSRKKHSNLPVSILSGEQAWWNPPSNGLEGAYFSCPPSGEKSQVAIYSDGYLYYFEEEW